MSGYDGYSTDPDLNTHINGINIGEGCPPGNINDAMRQMMAYDKEDRDAQNAAIETAQETAQTLATADTPGRVQPDGDTVRVNENGIITAGFTYKTTRYDTGKIWKDGKKIYGDVVYLGYGPNATIKTIPYDCSNIDTIISVTGTVVHVTATVNNTGNVPNENDTLFVNKYGNVITLLSNIDRTGAIFEATIESTDKDV